MKRKKFLLMILALPLLFGCSKEDENVGINLTNTVWNYYVDLSIDSQISFGSTTYILTEKGYLEDAVETGTYVYNHPNIILKKDVGESSLSGLVVVDENTLSILGKDFKRQ